MTVLACVEVGGSGSQTVLFDDDAAPVIFDRAHQPFGARLAVAVPGIIEGNRVLAASNLNWYDVDPVAALGLAGPAAALCNDAEAAALGEAELRGMGSGGSLVFVGLGTGVGGTVVVGEQVVENNLFGHDGRFSDRRCRCGRTGCLETVAAGWALPAAGLDHDRLRKVADAVGQAVQDEPGADDVDLVVVGGGIPRAHGSVVEFLGEALPGRRVEASAAPPDVKSASAWGLRRLLRREEGLR